MNSINHKHKHFPYPTSMRWVILCNTHREPSEMWKQETNDGMLIFIPLHWYGISLPHTFLWTYTSTHSQYCVWKTYHKNNSFSHVRHPCLWGSGWEGTQRVHCVVPAEYTSPQKRKHAAVLVGVHPNGFHSTKKSIPVQLHKPLKRERSQFKMHFNVSDVKNWNTFGWVMKVPAMYDT